MKRFPVIVSFLITLLLYFNPAFAEDGQLLAQSQYFTVYGYNDLDVYSLLNKLNFNYFLHMGAITDREDPDLKQVLAKTLDSMYLEVSDTLDIHIYSFHGTIRILPTQSDVDTLVRGLFRRAFNERSFYVPEQNTIYISFADLTLGMLGHEVAHAIISHYFVVAPPARVQEILCGYVEYGLRKSTK